MKEKATLEKREGYAPIPFPGILTREVFFDGGGWDVRHQSAIMRHSTCFLCDGKISPGTEHKLSRPYKWKIGSKKTGRIFEQTAYICDKCYWML